MKWFSYSIIEKSNPIPDIHIIRLVPSKDSLPNFRAGQYVYLKNPQYIKPHEEHAFSIASHPKQEILELCIREYGYWTQDIGKCNIGDRFEISEAQGNFIFDEEISYAVFLCGGVGISPIISILRDLAFKKLTPTITVLYGSRTPYTIVYKQQLEELAKDSQKITIKNIFSDYTPDKNWNGYHGFITKTIIKNEVEISKRPHWFITGPPIFIRKMIAILSEFNILLSYIHVEKI